MQQNKLYILWIVIFTFVINLANADDFSRLWKQIEELERNEQPRTEIEMLDRIINKATRQHAYGHLIKAQMKRISCLTSITPDSLLPEILKLEEDIVTNDIYNEVTKAIYHSILAQIYNEQGYRLGIEDYKVKSQKHYLLSLNNIPLLAKTKYNEFNPIIENGVNSDLFGNDLLHILGFRAEAYDQLYDYYNATSNIPATIITAVLKEKKKLKKTDRYIKGGQYFEFLDSLMLKYNKYDAACEIAIAQYEFMLTAKDVDESQLYAFAQANANKWNNWQRGNYFKNAINDLTTPQYNFTLHSNMFRPQQDLTFYFNRIRNIHNINISITKLNCDGRDNWNLYDKKDFDKINKLKIKTSQIEVVKSFNAHPAYSYFNDSITLSKLPIGVYLLEISVPQSNMDKSYHLIYVSDLQLMAEELPDNNIRYIVVNATSGLPIPYAKLSICTNYNSTAKINDKILTTDQKGEYTYHYSDRKPTLVWAHTDSDRFLPASYINTNFYGYRNTNVNNYHKLYTDRKLYRPGQTIDFALISYSTLPDNYTQPNRNEKSVVYFYDTNHRSIDTISVITDNFGKAHGLFTIPKKTLNGTYQIRTDKGGFIHIHVEDYKRPSFEIKLKEYKEEYSFGDTLLIEGETNSFTGVPIQNAVVSYTIKRSQAIWYRKYNNNNENELIFKDTTHTDSNGKFTIKMPMLLPDDVLDDDFTDETFPRFYNITALVKITDIAGESHTQTLNMPLGTKKTILSINIPNKILRDSIDSYSISSLNMAGNAIDDTAEIYVDNVFCGTFKTNTSNNFSFLKKFSSGKHIIKAVCNELTTESEFILFTLTDSKPTVETDDWYYLSSTIFPHDGKPIIMQIGSSEDSVHVVYNIFTHNKIIEQGTLHISNSLYKREFSYNDSYEGALFISYAWIKNGKLYRHSERLRAALPNKQLTTTWKTFRDRTQPGSKEEWVLHVKDKHSTNINAQLVATMYDKSLDQIIPNNWYFHTQLNTTQISTFWNKINSQQIVFGNIENYVPFEVHNLQFCHFNYYLFELYSPFRYNYSNVKVRGRGTVTKTNNKVFEAVQSDAMMTSVAMSEEVVKEEPVAYHTLYNNVDKDNEDISIQDSDLNNLRNNFNETALFFPDLTTNSDGDINIKFTLPETVTTWKFMGLVHDHNMNFGIINEEIIATKQLLVQPNMPRFMRLYDKNIISSRIVNSSELQQTGSATLQILSPSDEKLLYQQKHDFIVDSKSTINVDFQYTPTDENESLVICRILVETDSYSDGEQHYLPLLTNKELITNTKAFTLHSIGKHSFELNNLFPHDANNRTITLEFTNNPSWLIIQALPTYANTEDNNALSQATSLYLNTLGEHIMNLTPNIEKTIRSWIENNDQTILSEFNKNEELRLFESDDSPWTEIASNEISQKRNLVKFFDETTMKMRKNDAFKKLKKLQNKDGSWSWWQGMEGNIYITTTIVEMLVRINLYAKQEKIDTDILNDAFKYLDRYIVKEYDEILKLTKKERKQYNPSDIIIHLIYIYTLSNHLLASNVAKAKDFFVECIASHNANLSIYGKACGAVILAANQYNKEAEIFLNSIKEYSVYDENLGRFFDTFKADYSWQDYKIPTQVKAIEAFKLLKPEEKNTIKELQQWLLQQKRTTSWSNSVTTIDAINAFIVDNTDVLDDNSMPIIAIDNQVIDATGKQNGLGYLVVKKDYTTEKVITIEKQTSSTSWGAIYGQFYQAIPDIIPSSSGLSVKRKIISENQKLKVGDKVTVRLEITADHDFDFVEVIDKRPACLEPVIQLSGFKYGYYISTKDTSTNYYFDKMRKGTHIIETEYYIDRRGEYKSGSVTAQCTYAPAYMGRDKTINFKIQ